MKLIFWHEFVDWNIFSRMRGEAGIVKKKLQTLAKDSEDHKSSIGKMTVENQVRANIQNSLINNSDLV